MEAPRFYPIVGTTEQLAKVASLGYSWIQYRNKKTSPGDQKRALETMREYAGAPNQKIVLNDDAEMALSLGFDGVHLGQEDLERAKPLLPEIRNRSLLLGVSTHNPEELETALSAKPDYIAIGPLFASSSKPELVAGPLDEKIALLNLLRKRCSLPVVAIGGIHQENVHLLFERGFTTLAFIHWTNWIIERSLNPQKLAHRLGI